MTTSDLREREWRRALIERLALSDFGRVFALRGDYRKGLAKRLGVTDSTLREAAKLARAGFRSSGASGEPKKVIAELHVRAVAELSRPYIAMAEQLGMVQSHLFRSLMHTAMMSSREPTMRPGKVWTALPGCEKYRAWLDNIYYQRHDGELSQRSHIHVTCSAGLRDAIGMRATAFGVRQAHYMILWMADLVDGRLSEMQIEGVDLGQTFDDAKAYVLPSLPRSGAAKEDGGGHDGMCSE